MRDRGGGAAHTESGADGGGCCLLIKSYLQGVNVLNHPGYDIVLF